MINKSTGGILLLDEEKGMLCYRVHDGLSDTFAREQCLRPGEGISGLVAECGRSILMDDISTDPRATPLDMISSEGIRSFASVPLRAKGKVLGVLNIGSHEIGELTPEDMPLLESIAAQIAIAVENAKLHQEIQKKEVMRGELLREVFAIQEEERKRIARELHDETSQTLASLNVNLAVVESMLPPSMGTVKTRLQELLRVFKRLTSKWQLVFTIPSLGQHRSYESISSRIILGFYRSKPAYYHGPSWMAPCQRPCCPEKHTNRLFASILTRTKPCRKTLALASSSCMQKQTISIRRRTYGQTSTDIDYTAY